MARRRRRSTKRRSRKSYAVAVNPRRRTRRRRHAVAYAANPRRRRRSRSRSRRSYRRNPQPITTGFIWDAAYITGGFIGTRVASNMIFPMIPQVETMPILRIVGKGAVAWGVGWLGEMALGRRAGALLMVGGFVEVLNDAIKTYVAPFFPMLGNDGNAYPMIGSYPTLSSYPSLMGDEFVGVGEYSNEDAV